MKYIIPTLLAAPAFAHGSGHVHPHGIDALWFVAGATVIGAALVLAKVRK